MKIIIGSTFVSLLLLACGGGGGNSGICSGGAAYCAEFATNGTSNGPVTTPIVSTQAVTLCDVAVGPKLLVGSITDVHDGDSITLSVSGVVYKIRLDSIDAPELAQQFGNESRSALQNSVLGKTVRVAYAKTDQYDRIVGAVFTDTCQYVNLNQVATGMAWFYKAYQCETSATLRSQFAVAQDSAVRGKLGLWSQTSPVAPWFFRNGVEPATPVCSTDSPYWGVSPVTPVTTVIPVVPPTNDFSKLTCEDFQTQAAAQIAYNNGAIQLDGDRDGKACDSLR